jgi:hypothetical protein
MFRLIIVAHRVSVMATKLLDTVHAVEAADVDEADEADEKTRRGWGYV